MSESQATMTARLGHVAALASLLGSFALAPTAHGQSAPVAPPAGMDRAVAMLDEARRHFQNVRDYECRAISQERVNGVLLAEVVMTMKVRNRPFGIYLRNEGPGADAGMEVCYVAGRNGGKMRVNPAGVAGVFGFWSVDTRDARAFEKNRHCITEAGLGNLLESMARYWDMERRLDKTLVRFADDAIDGRASTRIETVHPDRDAAPYYGYRCFLWLDKETHLPLGAETYDWPRPGGAEGGDLLERYRYLSLRCNVGLGEDAFSH